MHPWRDANLKKKNCNNILIFKWSSSGKVFFSNPTSVDLLFGEKSQSTCLEDWNKPLITSNNAATYTISKLTLILMEFYPSIPQLKWLFIPTYKATSHSLWLQLWSLLIIGLYYLWIKNSLFDLTQDSKPDGICAWISRTKSGYANHWATLHWLKLFVWIIWMTN